MRGRSPEEGVITYLEELGVEHKRHLSKPDG